MAHYLRAGGMPTTLFFGSIPDALQDLQDIDRRFREHSKLAHSGAPVISLEVPLGDG